MSTLPIYWHVSENFGDRLTPWLVERITGRTAVEPKGDDVPFLVTGSIFGYSLRRGVVWGAGAAYEEHLDPTKLAGPSEHFRVVATRGPLSAAKTIAAGHEPRVFGDPGLLLPRFYQPSVPIVARAGIFCSWIDYDEVRSRYGGRFPIVSSLGTVESVVDQICSWDVVITNALHGIVAAVAYGKPVVWASFSDRILGDGFKYRDFFASLGVHEPRCVEARPGDEPDFESAAAVYPCEIVDALWAACPLPRREGT